VATSEPGPAARYLTSTKNITGCVLAVGGPVLALTGVVAPPLGLALVPALYAIGALAAPGHRHVDVVAGVDPQDVRRSLTEIRRRTDNRVPPEVSTRIARIADTITDTLPRADALGAGSPGQFVLVQCATDYLPTALQGYLDLPRNYADHHVVSDGKTPLALLTEQLDVLAKEIDEIADAVNRADTDRLIANGRFLAQKFGRGPLDIDGAARQGPSDPEDRTPPQ
jgi:hypothetical protein